MSDFDLSASLDGGTAVVPPLPDISANLQPPDMYSVITPGVAVMGSTAPSMDPTYRNQIIAQVRAQSRLQRQQDDKTGSGLERFGNSAIGVARVVSTAAIAATAVVFTGGAVAGALGGGAAATGGAAAAGAGGVGAGSGAAATATATAVASTTGAVATGTAAAVGGGLTLSGIATGIGTVASLGATAIGIGKQIFGGGQQTVVPQADQSMPENPPPTLPTQSLPAFPGFPPGIYPPQAVPPPSATKVPSFITMGLVLVAVLGGAILLARRKL